MPYRCRNIHRRSKFIEVAILIVKDKRAHLFRRISPLSTGIKFVQQCHPVIRTGAFHDPEFAVALQGTHRRTAAGKFIEVDEQRRSYAAPQMKGDVLQSAPCSLFQSITAPAQGGGHLLVQTGKRGAAPGKFQQTHPAVIIFPTAGEHILPICFPLPGTSGKEGVIHQRRHRILLILIQDPVKKFAHILPQHLAPVFTCTQKAAQMVEISGLRSAVGKVAGQTAFPVIKQCFPGTMLQHQLFTQTPEM